MWYDCIGQLKATYRLRLGSACMSVCLGHPVVWPPAPEAVCAVCRGCCLLYALQKPKTCMCVVSGCVDSWTSISGGMGVSVSLKKKKRLTTRSLIQFFAPSIILAASLFAEVWMPAQSCAQ